MLRRGKITSESPPCPDMASVCQHEHRELGQILLIRLRSVGAIERVSIEAFSVRLENGAFLLQGEHGTVDPGQQELLDEMLSFHSANMMICWMQRRSAAQICSHTRRGTPRLPSRLS